MKNKKTFDRSILDDFAKYFGHGTVFNLNGLQVKSLFAQANEMRIENERIEKYVRDQFKEFKND